MSTIPSPAALSRQGADRLQITWSDGRTGTILWSSLRENCPCALCNEDRHRISHPVPQPSHTGLSLTVLKEKDIPTGQSLIPRSIAPLGNYAYKITWSDGHDTGIYTFELLHSLCDWMPA